MHEWRRIAFVKCVRRRPEACRAFSVRVRWYTCAVWVCFVARRRLLVLHSTSLVDGFPLFGGTPDVESGLPRIFIL